jgi:hypothetical protein
MVEFLFGLLGYAGMIRSGFSFLRVSVKVALASSYNPASGFTSRAWVNVADSRFRHRGHLMPPTFTISAEL